MVSTGYYYPSVVATQGLRTPYWQNPTNIQNAADWGGSDGDPIGAQPKTHIELPKNTKGDRIIATNYGFNIPPNAKIDGVLSRVIRSGDRVRDSMAIMVPYFNNVGTNLSNKAKGVYKTNANIIQITHYGGTTDTWGTTKLTPSTINDPRLQFKFELENFDTSSHQVRVYLLGLNVYYTDPTYTLTSTLPSSAVIGGTINYQLKINSTNNIDQGVGIPIHVPIAAGFSLVSATSNEGIYDNTTSTWTPILNNIKQATLNITLTAVTVGEQTQTITELDYSTVLNKTCTIVAADSDDINYSTALLDDPKLLKNLNDGEIYTISAYNKVVDSVYTTGIFDGVRNNRIAVINGDEVTGARATTQNTVTRLGVTFRYNAAEPLILKLYGQYSSVSEVEESDWRGFQISQGDSTVYELPLPLFEDSLQLFGDTDTTTITIPANTTSSTYQYLIDNIPEQDGPEPFFTGIELRIDVEGRVDSGINVQLKNYNGKESLIKTLNFTTELDQILLGGDTDLWGLTSEDINLHNIIIEFTISNISLTDKTFTYNNIQLITYWQNDETYGAKGLTAKGLHSRLYNLQLKDVEFPEGAEKEIQTLSLTRTDGVLPVSETIKEKPGKIEFVVWGDTLEIASERLKLINTWLNNPRNELMIPVPYPLSFDHDPDRTWNVILTGGIDKVINNNILECAAEFLIPSGVAYNNNPKSTGNIGINEGNINVRPIISILCDGSASVSITDEVTDQNITINDTITSGTIILIDCENRMVTSLDGETDYTDHVNLNSVWFNIINDYEFTVTGGILQEVLYTEGY